MARCAAPPSTAAAATANSGTIAAAAAAARRRRSAEKQVWEGEPFCPARWGICLFLCAPLTAKPLMQIWTLSLLVLDSYDVVVQVPSAVWWQTYTESCRISILSAGAAITTLLHITYLALPRHARLRSLVKICNKEALELSAAVHFYIVRVVLQQLAMCTSSHWQILLLKGFKEWWEQWKVASQFICLLIALLPEK